MQTRLILFISLILTCGSFRAQEIDGFNNYRNNIVWYSDLGFNSAPFSIKYDYPGNIKRIRYRNNHKAVLGFGIAWKWFALRIGFDLPGTLRPKSKFGNTNYFDIGTDFTIKKTMIDIDYHNYTGYAIKNAHRWNDTLSSDAPHDLRPQTAAASFSINVWYFHNKDFKMQGLRLKTGSYSKEVRTIYLRSTINIHGVSNSPNSLIPYELQDTTNSKTVTRGIAAFDFGIIPGVGYVNNHKNWQYAAMFGLGPVIQAKVYDIPLNSRSYLGLAPRFDIRIYAGYSVPAYFVQLSAEFDNKSIRHTNLSYRQTFYTIKLTGGIRIDRKEKQKEKKSRQQIIKSGA